MQRKANLLALELQRDRILEALEAITADIYSAMKRVEQIDSPEEDPTSDEGLLA